MTATIIHADCLSWLREQPDGIATTIITDPPAAISFMGKDWDDDRGGRAQWVAWLAEILAECLRVVKPGGTLVCWALPKRAHWTGCAIEDAGWEVFDCVTHLFASGFPKSQDIGKALDRRAGAEREVVGRHTGRRATPIQNKAGGRYVFGPPDNADCSAITAPATPAAKTWDGWGTALAPSAEFWFLARRPCEGSFAANALAHGVAGLNIDGARTGVTQNDRDNTRKRGCVHGPVAERCYVGDFGMVRNGEPIEYHDLGRWPKNTILSCSCEDDTAHEPDCPVRMLGEQSGESTSSGLTILIGGSSGRQYGTMRGAESRPVGTQCVAYADHGTAARFFYQAKSSTSEREAGLLGYLPCLQCGQLDSTVHQDDQGREVRCRRNGHPTVKPVELMRYLARLTKMPGDGGLVFDPFAGSGTTGVACVLEGRPFIGVEMDEGYCRTAELRIADALAKKANEQPALFDAADLTTPPRAERGKLP